MKEKVSVVMPVLDTPREYLEPAITSILTQSYTNFELLIIDDGSTAQETLEALQDASRREKRIRLLRHNRRKGIVAALNYGLAQASGSLIARMDSDDISMPDRLEKQVDFLTENNDIDAVGTAVELFTTPTKDSDSNTLDKNGQKACRSRVIVHPTSPAMVRWAMFFYCSIAHPSVLARKEALLQYGGYSESFPFCEDYHLWLQMAWGVRGGSARDSGSPISSPSFVKLQNKPCLLANLPEVLVRLRKHSGSVSSSRGKDQSEGANQALRHILSKHILGVDTPLHVVKGLAQPSQLKDLELLHDVYDLLLQLEQYCCASNIVKDIQEDATSRVGEIVTVAMKLDPTSPITRKMWCTFIKRDPSALFRLAAS